MSVSIDREVMFPVHVGGRFIGTFKRSEMIELKRAIDETLLTDHRITQAESIILTVCDWFGLSRTELMSLRRTERLVWPRQVAMQMVRLRCEMSLNDVGILFGGKNHGTVLHACRRVEERKLIAYYARVIAAVEESIDSKCAKSSAAQRNVDSSLDAGSFEVPRSAGTGAVGV
jgi:DnaA-like protein